MVKASNLNGGWRPYTESGITGGWRPYEPAKWLQDAISRGFRNCNDHNNTYTLKVRGRHFDYKIILYGQGLGYLRISRRERR